MTIVRNNLKHLRSFFFQNEQRRIVVKEFQKDDGKIVYGIMKLHPTYHSKEHINRILSEYGFNKIN